MLAAERRGLVDSRTSSLGMWNLYRDTSEGNLCQPVASAMSSSVCIFFLAFLAIPLYGWMYAEVAPTVTCIALLCMFATLLRVPLARFLKYLYTVLRYELEKRKRRKKVLSTGDAATPELRRRLLTDPTTNGQERCAVVEDCDVVIIGAGIGGLLAAHSLKKIPGLIRFRIIDKAGSFGGVWYWNRYPGSHCDIESSIYLPLLEEMGYTPRKRYSSAEEIFEYCGYIAQHIGVATTALFSTTVTSSVWRPASSRWEINTDRGDRLSSKFMIVATGTLSNPKFPSIPGIASFKGPMFHSSRWDYGVTGGSSSRRMTKLADMRVALIGTGATAVQCLHHLARDAQHVYVFQRTPSAISERDNRILAPESFRSLPNGWQRNRMRAFDAFIQGESMDDIVSDGFTKIFAGFNLKLFDKPKAEAIVTAETLNFDRMEAIRNRVARIVRNPKFAESLKPYYRLLCKRPCFSDEYLEAFNQPNVSLIDTDGKGVEEISSCGVRAAGSLFTVDCIIFASGFEVSSRAELRFGFDIIGRDAVHLSHKWENGPSTLHGMLSNGFPNCFFIGSVQTGFSTNNTHMALEQSEHISFIVQQAMRVNASAPYAEATLQAELDWVSLLQDSWRSSPFRQYFNSLCTPSYLNSQGNVDDAFGLLRGFYTEGPLAFFRLLSQWRNEGGNGVINTPIP